MIYLHLTLLHIPAVVRRCNIITLETFDVWPTPAHVLDGWGPKLRLEQAVRESRRLLIETESEAVTVPALGGAGPVIEDADCFASQAASLDAVAVRGAEVP